MGSGSAIREGHPISRTPPWYAHRVPQNQHEAATTASLKCVLVGDSGIGKTSLLINHAVHEFFFKDQPICLEGYWATVMVDGKPVKVDLWDTAGAETYDGTRPLAYPQTDLFLICFSLTSPASLESVRTKWYLEVQHHCPNTPIMLLGILGTFTYDTDSAQLRLYGYQTSIDFLQAHNTAKAIGAVKYQECSAGVRFSQILRTALKARFQAVLGSSSRSHLQDSASPVRSRWPITPRLPFRPTQPPAITNRWEGEQEPPPLLPPRVKSAESGKEGVGKPLPSPKKEGKRDRDINSEE